MLSAYSATNITLTTSKYSWSLCLYTILRMPSNFKNRSSEIIWLQAEYTDSTLILAIYLSTLPIVYIENTDTRLLTALKLCVTAGS